MDSSSGDKTQAYGNEAISSKGNRPVEEHVVVIGAGLSGLTAAARLEAEGFTVTVLEKSRGPGGRMSTRREPAGQFNLGAQYFTASHPAFIELISTAMSLGVVKEWQARIGVLDSTGWRTATSDLRRFVGMPGMNALCRHLVSPLRDVRFNWAVAQLDHSEMGWKITSSNGDILTADALVLTTPPEQARKLLPAGVLNGLLDSLQMKPCWAVMAVLDQPILEDFDAAFINMGPLSWIAAQADHANSGSAWVLHASADWSRKNLEKDSHWVSSELLLEARKLAGAEHLQVVWSKAHRWRYCQAVEPLRNGVLHLPASRLVLAGDWCQGSKVEGAFRSGMHAADSLVQTTGVYAKTDG
jgi:predicted NAD/FAD-dependent oxidoreductase